MVWRNSGGICERKILFRMKKETEAELRARERAIIAGGHRKSVGPQKEDNRPPLHLLLFIAFVNCHPQPVTLLLPLLLLLLGFVFLLPSPLRNRRRSSALASSPLLAHGSFLLLLRDPNGSLFPPRCPHPDPQVLLPCRGGDLPTPRRCRHYLLVAIRWPERLSARVQLIIFCHITLGEARLGSSPVPTSFLSLSI